MATADSTATEKAKADRLARQNLAGVPAVRRRAKAVATKATAISTATANAACAERDG
jgi:hypothetical protein